MTSVVVVFYNNNSVFVATILLNLFRLRPPRRELVDADIAKHLWTELRAYQL